MQGRAFLVSFLATEKRNSPGKAKQVTSAELDNQPSYKSPADTPSNGSHKHPVLPIR
ncbi:hypothetical protein [Metapseudomonas otitidis]|uniref:hypothetical protein n=1 Tax=Metapseudomonas otitidis TaxID=319939 RepID=UPI0013F64140|nr:hypothetical protein [Pseudomonas otitidis]